MFYSSITEPKGSPFEPLEPPPPTRLEIYGKESLYNETLTFFFAVCLGGFTFFERLTDPKDTQKLYQATDLTRRQYSIED